MKHRHLFVPPFWKYNRFCLLCGRLESLTVGKNTVQLSDNKILFGASVSLDNAKQLGFNASNKLIYYDTSEKVVADTTQISSVVKVAEWYSSSSVVITGTTETLITSYLLGLDFNNYKYFVSEIVGRNVSHNYVINASGAGIFTLNFYARSDIGTPTATLKWDIGTAGLTSCYGYFYALYHNFNTDVNNPYLVIIYAEDKENTENVLVNGTDRYEVAAGMNSNALNVVPNQFKLTGYWNTTTGVNFTFSPCIFRIYGYRS